MGQQAKRRAESRESAERARKEKLLRSLARDARTRGEQYAAAPEPGWLPVGVPALPLAHLDWARSMLPLFIPAPWRLHQPGDDGWCFIGPPPASLKLIVSAEPHPDGRRWLHCSLTAADRTPTWDEIVAAKEAFCGRESLAVQVIPPRSEWITCDPRCLHWWVCADGRPLPDFTLGRGTI